MKYLFSILVLFFTVNATAQQNSFVKYFDSSWHSCAKDTASFYSQFESLDTAYKCKSYYLPSMKLYATSTCRDTLFKNRFGWMVRYFKNGSLRDSTEYDLKGSAVSIKTFYTNGLLRTSIIKREDRVIVGQSFDEEGKLSETFTKVETSFPGGMDAWSEYLKGHLRQNLPVRQGAPPGKYTVILNFSIDTNGNIQNITADNDPGYGTKEEAIRVLSKSPKWIPATQNGIKVISKHKQSITFEVSEK